MFILDADLPERLRPLAWMVGRWEGVGVVGYPTIESVNFGQEVVCSHDGRGFLEWSSHTWLLEPTTGERVRPLATELGFWRPGEDGADVELLLAHPTGVVEMYYGSIEPAKVYLRTDSVVRSPLAKEYNAGSRMYGLVDSQLMWVMDMAAVDQPMQSHISATLTRME
ncbi:FABP family protein [Dermatophilaceae bacterium Soc4.6]